MHEMKKTKQKAEDPVPRGPEPSYLLERQEQQRSKILSNMIKQKRKEKAVSSLY
jgi:ribosome biogenesis protein NSA2